MEIFLVQYIVKSNMSKQQHNVYYICAILHIYMYQGETPFKAAILFIIV